MFILSLSRHFLYVMTPQKLLSALSPLLLWLVSMMAALRRHHRHHGLLGVVSADGVVRSLLLLLLLHNILHHLVLDLAGDGLPLLLILLLLHLLLAGQHGEGLGLPEAGVPEVRGVEDGELLLVRGVRAEARRHTPHYLNRIIISGLDTASVALSQCWDHLVFVRE